MVLAGSLNDEGHGAVTVAFQGEPGAYSEGAARKLLAPALHDPSHLKCVGLQQFEDVFSAVQRGSVHYGVIPVENTLGGSIHAQYDLLMQYSDLHIVGELDFRVQHCLLALPGCKHADIKLVISHPQALAQCDGYLRSWGVQTRSVFDTAGSAKMIQQQNLRDTAAIASELAAETYGLEVLAKHMQDVDFNHTRFIMICREPCAVPREPPGSKPGGVKTSVVFWLTHNKPGALFKAISAFALRDLGLTKTESRPVPSTYLRKFIADGQILVIPGIEPAKAEVAEAKFHYIIYIDVLAHAESQQFMSAIEHLRELTPFVRVLGPYMTEGNLTSDVVQRIRAAVPPPTAPAASQDAKADGLRIAIVGFGKFGQFLAKHLIEKHQVFVTSCDSDCRAAAAEIGVVWVPWEGAVQDMLLTHRVDVLLVAVSILSFSDVIETLPVAALKQAKPLIVDVLSVKGFAKQVFLKHIPSDCDIICTHPMFGPESGRSSWHDLPFIFEMVRARSWDRAQRFLNIFESAGCRMVSMSCEDHDHQTAASQFITHLTGRVLAEHGCDPTPIDTVGYQNLCKVAEHTCKDSFELFYGLFKYNASATQQLGLFKRGIADIENLLMKRQEDEERAQIVEKKKSRPVVSSLVRGIAASKTAQIQALSKKLQEEGHKVNAALCVGEPGYPPPPEVLAALQDPAFTEAHTKYTVVQGDSKLRTAICVDLRARKGVTYDPNQIVVTCGGKQAIYEAFMAVCEDGDEILVPTPCWVSYHDIARLCRATPVPVATEAAEGYVLQPSALAAALEASGERCRAVVICNPCNPTGAVIPPETLLAIADVLRLPQFAHIHILADEIYERLIFEPAKHVCFASLPGMFSRTLLINGFSKGYAMTGFRLGYLATGCTRIAGAVAKVQGQITSCASSVSQHAGLAALEGGASVDVWCQERVGELRVKRDLVVEALSSMTGVSLLKVPDGAFYVLVCISGLIDAPGAKVKSAEAFCEVLLREHLVSLVPGEAFHAPGTVRISYACSTEDLQSAMSAFADCVHTVSPDVESKGAA